MFSLQNAQAKLDSINIRSELHGDEHVPACDLKFTLTTGNEILSEFDPTLRSWLYKAADSENLDLADQAGDPNRLSVLAHPLLAMPIKWAAEFAGYTLHFHWGATGKNDIELEAKQIDGFRFDCKDGGSVDVSWRVIVHPSEREVGRLCGMVQQTVEISLLEPEAEDGLRAA